jgi:quercetin dioxygenase-like cupin family protein
MATPHKSTPQVVNVADQPQSGWSDARGELTWRRLFGGDDLPTDTMTMGVATLEPGGFLALHRHAPAELYYILEGRGRVQLDGVERDVKAGDGVFIPGDAEHGIRNVAAEPLRFLYVFAVDRFDTIEYRFS